MQRYNPRCQNENCSVVDAGINDHVDTVRKLLQEGHSILEMSGQAEGLLCIASQAGHFKLVEYLVAMGADIEERGMNGDRTPLMEAAIAGHVNIVSHLLVNGVDINAQCASGNTALMYACANGHMNIVMNLLVTGAIVDNRNKNGHTPLMIAASSGHVEIARSLCLWYRAMHCDSGINWCSNESGESALTLARDNGDSEMVEFLLEEGVE